MKMMFEMSEMIVIVESMMNYETIRVVRFSAIHSFDIELLRTTFYSSFSRTLSDSSFNSRSRDLVRP